MIISKTDEYLEKYSKEAVHIDSFSVEKMGLIQAETTLKIDTLKLPASPFQISMERAVLLCVLNEREIPFFSQYTQKTSSLKFSFMQEDDTKPIKFMVWTKLNSIISLKGRQNLCMVDLSFKNCPNDLITIIGQYIEFYHDLQYYFESYKNKEILIDKTTSKDLSFNNYAEVAIGNRSVRVNLLTLSVNKLLMVIPAVDPAIKKGFQMGCKLYFRKHRVTLKGVVAQTSKVINGFMKLYYVTPFSPELADIIHDYFALQQYKQI